MQFTQYKFPDGHPVDVSIEMPADIENKAAELASVGWRFEVENHDGIVNADCCDADGQLSNFSIENGPDIPTEVEKLVLSAHAEWIKRGKPSAKQ
jgi:hypothetical protein